MPRWAGSSTPCSTRRAPSAAAPRTPHTPRASRATPTSTSSGCCPASTPRSTSTRRALCRAAPHGLRPRAAPCAWPPPTACAHLARQLGWGTRPASARLGSGQPPASASLGQLAEARCRPASPSLSSAHRLCAPRYAPPPPPPRWAPRRASLASASARPGRRRMQRGGRRAALRVERRGRASCAPGRASDRTRRGRDARWDCALRPANPGATSLHTPALCACVLCGHR